MYCIGQEYIYLIYIYRQLFQKLKLKWSIDVLICMRKRERKRNIYVLHAEMKILI